MCKKSSGVSNFKYAQGLTTDEHIKKAKTMQLDILAVLSQESLTDADSQSSQVLERYAEANEIERAAMDALLIDVCGWSMASLIDIAERDGFVEEG